MKKLITTVIFIMFCFNCFSQNATDTSLLNKYWNYRNNYKKLFTKIGKNRGESIPFCTTDGACADKEIDMGADGTVMLGFYIAILATEYYLSRPCRCFHQQVKTLKPKFALYVNAIKFV